MNYLICDDEPAAAESLKAKIAELEPDSSVRIFTTRCCSTSRISPTA